MGYWPKTALGLALMAAGLGALVLCITELASVGTCASGGSFEIVRECPTGTEKYIIGIFPSVMAFLGGAYTFATRGGRATKPGLPPGLKPRR